MSKHQPRKRFGQHFLIDSSVLQRLVSAIHPQTCDRVLEIGPGQGALTELMINQVAKLLAVEIDRDLVKLLHKKFAQSPQLSIAEADILTFDLSQYSEPNKPWRIIGNCPYNISTPLLFKLFEFSSYIKDMHLMLQLEVVERLTASPGSRHYGRLSIMAQYYAHTSHLFDVSANAFNPPPRVHSAVIRLTPHQPPLAATNIDHFAFIVRTAFNQRRKTIHNALKKIVPASHWETLTIDIKARPQDLQLTDYVKISNSLVQTVTDKEKESL